MHEDGQVKLLWFTGFLTFISVIALGLILYNINLDNSHRDKYGFSSDDLRKEIDILEKGVELFIANNKDPNPEQENELLILQDELFALKQIKADFIKKPFDKTKGQKISTGSKILKQAKDRLSNLQTLDEKPKEVESGRSVSQ